MYYNSILLTVRANYALSMWMDYLQHTVVGVRISFGF